MILVSNHELIWVVPWSSNMASGKWKSVSVYAPLISKIELLIKEEIILYSNPNQFVNAVVERAITEILLNNKLE